MTERQRERAWDPGRPVSVRSLLGQHRRGAGDPTHRLGLAGGHWRASRTPDGPATLRLQDQAPDGLIHVTAWGPGAVWALDRVPALLGAEDDWTGFEPRHPVVEEAWRHHRNARIGRTGLVWEALVPAIIEQKVTGQEAFAGFRALVRRFGEPAPGPVAEIGLRVQPTPGEVAAIPSWSWLDLHIDPARSRTLVGAAARAGSIERTIDLNGADAERAWRSLPGIGVWTSAEVRQRAFGDPDAVSFGDYHVAKDVGWALTGAPFDDRQLATYLEPWRGHRGRVPFLLGLSGLRRERHGPRMAPRRHLKTRNHGS